MNEEDQSKSLDKFANLMLLIAFIIALSVGIFGGLADSHNDQEPTTIESSGE